jgi:type VII secretion protein EccE
MKAQRRLGLALAWPRVTAVFVADVAILALASHFPGAPQKAAWWVGVSIAALVTITMIVTHRGITFASAIASFLARLTWDLLARKVRDAATDPEATLTPECTPAVDHKRRFGRDIVGVREYQGQLVALVAVDGRAEAAAGRHQHESVSSGTLPVAAVAEGLRQFDVRLDGIDIVSVRRRRAPSDNDASSESPEIPHGRDDQSADVQYGTWLVLRMDPQRNVAALVTRDSVASTLAAAAERLTGDLAGRRCAARPLSGDEFAAVDDAIAAGLLPAATRPGWGHLTHDDLYVTSFWVSPRDITSETLDWLWSNHTEATVVTIRLSAAAAGRVEVSAWVRYHSKQKLDKEACAGLNRLTGRQLAAVRASLPAPAQRPLLVLPSRTLGEHEDLAVGLGPTLVGAAPQHTQ